MNFYRRLFLRMMFFSPILLLLSPWIRAFSQELHQKRFSIINRDKPLVLRVEGSDIIAKNVEPENYLEAIQVDNLALMLEEGIKSFSNQTELRQAWLYILNDYSPGDKIAIKPNFNFVNHGNKYTITSPQLINSVVKQLVEVVGMNPEDIYLYDLCKKIPTGIVKEKISYPINYVERIDTNSIIDKFKLRLYYGLASGDPKAMIQMRENIIDEEGDPVKCYVPKVLTIVKHIINMPLLTNHIYISNSGALKNHYGTVRFNNFNPYPVALHGKVLEKSIVDINRAPHIKNKTKIIIADGLFGVFDRGEGAGKKEWRIFNNSFPKSIFISKDPVAIDSIMATYINQERNQQGFELLSTGYLYDAMHNGLGICEIRDKDDKFENIQYLTLKI